MGSWFRSLNLSWTLLDFTRSSDTFFVDPSLLGPHAYLSTDRLSSFLSAAYRVTLSTCHGTAVADMGPWHGRAGWGGWVGSSPRGGGAVGCFGRSGVPSFR